MKKILIIMSMTLFLVACGDPKVSADIPDGEKLNVLGAAVHLENGNMMFVVKYKDKYGIADIDDADLNYLVKYIETNGFLDTNLLGMETKFIHWENNMDKLENWGDKHDILIQPIF